MLTIYFFLAENTNICNYADDTTFNAFAQMNLKIRT